MICIWCIGGCEHLPALGMGEEAVLSLLSLFLYGAPNEFAWCLVPVTLCMPLATYKIQCTPFNASFAIL